MSEILIRLRRLREDEAPVAPGTIPLPAAGQVLYAHPNPDGTEKACSNCHKWTRNDKKCLDVDGALQANQVCGYHVFGVPRSMWMDLGQSPVDQELAGVVNNPTSCGTCRYSVVKADRAMYCRAVASEDGGNQQVKALGCCVLWTQK